MVSRGARPVDARIPRCVLLHVFVPDRPGNPQPRSVARPRLRERSVCFDWDRRVCVGHELSRMLWGLCRERLLPQFCKFQLFTSS